MRSTAVAMVALVAVAGCSPDADDLEAASSPPSSELIDEPATAGRVPEPESPDEPMPEDASLPESGSDPEPQLEPAPEPESPMPPGPPSDERTLEHVTTIRGDISPKSVVSSHTGVFFAQNMMYRHTITVYDRDHELVATIPDTVTLEDHGIDGPGVELRGAPVEMAFSPDGEHAYVSNYKMYGPGFDRGGGDTCSPADGYDESFVYRIDVGTLEIDQVIPVGSVPKYVAVPPDGRRVLVTNWCSYDVSIIDAQLGEEIERVDIGRYPRGIAVTGDSSTAYIAVMGSSDIAVLDLEDLTVTTLDDVGRSPRHVVLDPEDGYLYATLNGEGVVARLDLDTGETVRVRTGDAPRTMDISADGLSLYVATTTPAPSRSAPRT